MSNSFSAAITFGRMNPPTTGHLKLLNTLDNLNVDRKIVFLSKSHDAKKNPLEYLDKLAYVRAIVNENFNDIEVADVDTNNLYGVLHKVYEWGCDDIYIVLGGDRIPQLQDSIPKYNGLVKEGADGPIFNFREIHFVNAGERTEVEGTEDTSAMSATKARNYARDNDLENFSKCIPTKDKFLIKDLFNDVRKGLKIKNGSI